MKAAVAGDRILLEHFYARASGVKAKDDPKLKALVEEGLKPILRQSQRESRNEDEFRLKRKVLIFTYFADTAEWISDYLQEQFDKNPALKPYRGRLISITGKESSLGIPRQEAVFRFAPQSSEAPPGYEDDFDVLVTTDVLAEGMNLQQCRHIINYDLPWNPMRLVQRHGRIDRIGSPHKDVYIRCFFPDRNLEDLLELEPLSVTRWRKRRQAWALSMKPFPARQPASACSPKLGKKSKNYGLKTQRSLKWRESKLAPSPARLIARSFARGLKNMEIRLKTCPGALVQGCAANTTAASFAHV